MMNANLLKGVLRSKGITQETAARKIGISLSRFNAKLNGTGGAEFSLGDVQALRNYLELTPEDVDRIFFEEKVS